MSEAGTAQQFEFAGFPEAVAGEVRSGAEAFKHVLREYQRAQERHGVLVPMTTVAEALDVSGARVFALVDEGRLDAVEVVGRRWVIAESVVRYLAEGPRKPGRPKKLSKLANSVRMGRELAASAEDCMK